MREGYVFSHVVDSEKYKRVPCISQVRTANMVYNGTVFGTLSEERNDAGEFDWVIKIDWDAWEKCGCPQVSGIDDIHRKDEYIRRYIPAVVEQRTLPDNRVNLQEELDRLGLTSNDRFEYMCRTHGLCGPSRFLIERHSEQNKGD